MDLLYLLKKKFKKLLSDILITGMSFENLSYLSSCLYHKDKYSEEYTRTYYEALNQTLLHKSIGGRLPIHFKVWKLMVPVRCSMLKNKRIFSLVISRSMPDFSTVQLDVAKNHIN